MPYVKLNPDYTRRIDWSNDPADLDLNGAFSQDESNLASDFLVKGLCPILRDPQSDRYMLKDAEGVYYLWDAWDGHLLKVTEEWTQGPELELEEDVVDNILCNLY